MECPRYGIEGPRPSLEVGVIRRGRPYMNLHQSNVHAKVFSEAPLQRRGRYFHVEDTPQKEERSYI